MSEENVRRTHEFIDAYNRRDFEAAFEHVHPQVEWVLPAQQESDSGTGPEHVRRFFEGIDEHFDELQLVPQESVDAGDRVAVRLRHRARGKGSGLELDEELYHQVTTFRDGVMVRIKYFDDWGEALRASGRAP